MLFQGPPPSHRDRMRIAVPLVAALPRRGAGRTGTVPLWIEIKVHVDALWRGATGQKPRDTLVMKKCEESGRSRISYPTGGM